MDPKFVFGTIAVGLAAGSYVANKVARRDLVGWSLAGAIPGASLLSGELRFMLALVVILPLLVVRAKRVRNAHS